MSEVTTGSNASVAARALLEAERDSLRAELADLSGQDYDANFADTSQVTAERGEADVLASTLQESLDEVERALGKLDDGTYGKCEVCGEEIAAARLEAMPAARYCITHASTRR
jgi:RNA polymerase-binding transcription factor DksA